MFQPWMTQIVRYSLACRVLMRLRLEHRKKPSWTRSVVTKPSEAVEACFGYNRTLLSPSSVYFCNCMSCVAHNELRSI